MGLNTYCHRFLNGTTFFHYIRNLKTDIEGAFSIKKHKPLLFLLQITTLNVMPKTNKSYLAHVSCNLGGTLRLFLPGKLHATNESIFSNSAQWASYLGRG